MKLLTAKNSAANTSHMHISAPLKLLYAVLCMLLVSAYTDAATSRARQSRGQNEPQNLYIFRRAYPDVTFDCRYDGSVQDWHITVTVPFASGAKTAEVYWADGKMIPPAELKNKDRYWSLLYRYPAELADPADFTPQEIERMRNFGSAENRRNGAGTPMFLSDILYDSGTRQSLESHIISVEFLGRTVRVHERLQQVLKRVEKRITDAAKNSVEISDFIKETDRIESYYWRYISETNRKSFHSLGIAIDILPKNLRGKAIYWSWTKSSDPENWMLTPLSKRWMPPKDVIDIFEDEGFIWGGKWSIWDNMHFEYHPELIAYRAAQQ